MKISEIIINDVIEYLRIDTVDFDANLLAAIMEASKKYISAYTGIAIESNDTTVETLDDHPDFYIAYMALCQDMYDNRTIYTDKSNANKTVQSILDMHPRILL
jgi:uncharacterized phage protein (predicted DNA packaging)